MAGLALRNVFVYGTLLAPEVVSALIHRSPPSSVAFVPDYHRHSIKDCVYPAIVPAIGDKVFGKVLHDLTEHELAVLDEFEDIEYSRVVVKSFVLDDSAEQIASATEEVGSPVQAYIYVWATLNDERLYGEWDYEEWRRVHLEDYTKMCKALEAKLSKLWHRKEIGEPL